MTMSLGMKARGRPGGALGLAALALGLAAGCGHGNGDPPVKVAGIQPRRMDKETAAKVKGERDRVVELLKSSQGEGRVENARLVQLLSASLAPSGKQERKSVLPAGAVDVSKGLVCYKAGCFIDFPNPSPELLDQLSGMLTDPDLPLRDWKGARYRSGLVEEGGKTYVTLVFLAESKGGGVQ